jgi:Bacterial regulatory helix-turn-helix protein, lysR family
MTTDLNSLTLFAKVVEANSFSEAARRLDTPISTVSRRIAELEAQLGVRLLDAPRAGCASRTSGPNFSSTPSAAPNSVKRLGISSRTVG